MKYLLLILLVNGCTQKYQTYHVIQKNNFSYPGDNNPITKKMLPGKRETQSSCEGQWLFMRNAHKINQSNVRSMVQFTCPKSRFLLNSKITETWWTTIIYSRSCIDLEAYCERK